MIKLIFLNFPYFKIINIKIKVITIISIIVKDVFIPVLTEIINFASEISLSLFTSFSFCAFIVFDILALFVIVPIELLSIFLSNNNVTSLDSPGFISSLDREVV